jgi:GT2 family glycosyltransferase
LLVRREVYEQVGGLDEQLAVAFNDIDFCLRVRAAGYRNVWTPYAEMVHHESASRGDDSGPKLARFAAEIAYMQRRWGAQLHADPAYNPNLSAAHDDFSYAWPPRQPEH